MEVKLKIEPLAPEYMADPKDANNIYYRVINNIKSTTEFFYQKYRRRVLCYDYYKGKQWTQQEIDLHYEQNRLPVVFNEIQPKVDHLVGTETQTRMDTRILPREKGDEAAAQLLNFIIKWCEQINQIEYIQTEVFRDMAVGGASCVVIRWRSEDIEYGYPAIEKVPINEMFWDFSALKPDLSDARWMARVSNKTKYEAAEIFPEFRNVIYNSSTNDNTPIQIINADHRNLAINNLKTSNNIQNEIVQIIEYYERKKIYVYLVVDEIKNDSVSFTYEKDANNFYNALINEYVKQNEDIENPDGTQRVYIVTLSKDIITQTIIIGDQVVSHNDLDISDFPYVIGFAYYNEGDFWSFVDQLIDPQILVNRFFSQWDYQLGLSPKNFITVISSMLKKGWSEEDLRREISKTMSVIPVINHGAVNIQEGPRITPELFHGINFAIQRMNDYAGGRNLLGLQENAAESGRAVIARAEQGGIGRLPLFDALKLWRKCVTERFIYLIKNVMPPNQILRITGIDEEVEFVQLDDQIMKTLRELRYDIEIDEAEKSATMKERNFIQLKELFSIVQMPPEILVPMMIEYSALPKSKKREILDQMQFYQEYVAMKAQKEKEEKLTQEVKDSLFKKKLKDELTLTEKLDEIAEKIKKKQKSIKTKLEDIEQIKQEMEEKKYSPAELNKLYNKLNTPEELRELPKLMYNK